MIYVKIDRLDNGGDRMALKHKVKITVLKRELYQDLQEQYLANPKSGKCEFFKEGQEWTVESQDFFKMLNGTFCSEAWDSISRYVYAALQGGSIMRGWTNDEKVMITCCNDGTRPVNNLWHGFYLFLVDYLKWGLRPVCISRII
ncbi:hypothetical protein Holit_02240 [Hollandina sp. SP2]